jgi:hypothetical protein
VEKMLSLLRPEINALNTWFLEYRICVIQEPTAENSKWCMAVVLSEREQAWRQIGHHVHDFRVVSEVLHEDQVTATRQALGDALQWARERMRPGRKDYL